MGGAALAVLQEWLRLRRRHPHDTQPGAALAPSAWNQRLNAQQIRYRDTYRTRVRHIRRIRMKLPSWMLAEMP